MVFVLNALARSTTRPLGNKDVRPLPAIRPHHRHVICMKHDKDTAVWVNPWCRIVTTRLKRR
eukprot:SAG31_NODE_10183_length_1174_cov_1.049302_1_plen_61_part_10